MARRPKEVPVVNNHQLCPWSKQNQLVAVYHDSVEGLKQNRFLKLLYVIALYPISVR